MTQETKNMLRHASAPPGGPEERSDGGPPGGAARPPDPEVAAKPTRRVFTAAYKLRLLEELDQAAPGEQGAILRREGLYTSHIVEWRRLRRAGALGSLGKKRGRKPKDVDPLQKKVDRLERELARTREELRKAHLILDVQGKVAELLGFSLAGEKDS